ncbi:E3 ubiquitin/ISG15 ligase TRIM25-like [Engystomops pustulosus]|uniref:E3 ubiquitin/ISG15 ligase TRIM25-like n=1 Tax=Engystomops pustulosus TaxID=76066 RepID=UPI003AFACE6A
MASSDLREELLCSICLSLYTDPVTLRCGHNFCRVCIEQVLNTQDESGVYSCPECRAVFQERPGLQRNITLRNIAERFLFTEPHQEEVTGICCTYCIHSPVPAVKSCLHCEASLCDDHLRVHSKGPEHVLTDPSTSLENRKCPVHKKILEYYCKEDKACICVSCSVDGEHRGHKVEMLDAAYQKKKNKMRDVLQKLTTKREETEERVQSLEERWRKALEKASGEAERVTALFIDLKKGLDDPKKRRQLEDLEKKVLSEISRQEEQVSLSLSALIRKLEIKKDELSRKMKDIEELCNMTDPLTVLQEPDTGDLCDPEEGGGDEDTGGHDGHEEDTGGHDGGDEDTGGHDGGDEDTGGHDETHDVDVDVITRLLHEGLSDIMTYLQTISPAKPGDIRPQPPSPRFRNKYVGGKVISSGDGGIYGEGPAVISLDVSTAHNNIIISEDLKTATRTTITQNRPETPVRFRNYQVMSSRGFTSGRHYWDVEISGSVLWRVGMCYPSIDRRGRQSLIGDNNKSWGLCRRLWFNDQYLVRNDNVEIQLAHQISCDRVRICLDYEAGELSFYELCDPIRHLHSFTTTFTEPLHAVLCVGKGSLTISMEAPALRDHHQR